MCAETSKFKELSSADLEKLITTREGKLERIIAFIETVVTALKLPYKDISMMSGPLPCWPDEPTKPKEEYTMKGFYGFTIQYRDWSWKHGNHDTRRHISIVENDKVVASVFYDGALLIKGERISNATYHSGNWEKQFEDLMENPERSIEWYKTLISERQYEIEQKQSEKQIAKEKEIYEQNHRIGLLERARELGLE